MSALFRHFCFAQPGWLLLFLPSLLLLVLRRGRGASEAIVFSSLSILASLGSKVRQSAWNLGIPLGFTALVLSTLSLARPVWRDEVVNRTASGIDIMIALDVSLSMKINDFTDNGVPVGRIDVAKAVVKDFIAGRPDDRIGLVAFAGRPSSISPITLDHEWLLKGLETVRPEDFIEDQGTAIGSGIASAAIRLDARDAKSKIIVLITDGANNSGKLAPIEAAQQAKELGIKIYTIAIGTAEGRVSEETQRFPGQEFDLPTLRKIASVTGAEHYRADDLTKLKNSFQSIDRLEKSEAKSHPTVEDIELFPWFAGIAAAAGFIAALMLSAKPT
jgi:Ca-activated chloride channel family protein